MKKVPIYKNEHIQQRLVELRRKGWQVKQICRRLGFSEATYYKALGEVVKVTQDS